MVFKSWRRQLKKLGCQQWWYNQPIGARRAEIEDVGLAYLLYGSWRSEPSETGTQQSARLELGSEDNDEQYSKKRHITIQNWHSTAVYTNVPKMTKYGVVLA